MQLPPCPKKQTLRNAAFLPQEVTYLQKYIQHFKIVIWTHYLKKPNEFSTATTVSAYPCLKINSEHIKLVMIWPICGESVHHLIRLTVNRHYLVYPQHRQLTQVQLLRRHPAHLSLLKSGTLQTISITLTRTFCPEQLIKRQSERL